MTRELDFVRAFYSDVRYVSEGRWVLLPAYRLPEGVWRQAEVELCFQIPENYPGQSPYAFYVNPSLRLADASVPNNFEISVPTVFAGSWGKFSWIVDPWQPDIDPKAGSNLVDFIRSCGYRLREGTWYAAQCAAPVLP